MADREVQPATESAPWRVFGVELFLPRTRLLGWLALGAIVSLPLVLYSSFLDNPFERDEGVYATMAQGWLAGDIPYRDLFDNKPPLVYLWYALSFSAFGEEVFAPRLVASVLLACTTLVIFLQARLLFHVRVAYIAAALFGISTGIPFIALHSNSEPLMMLPLMGSLLALTLGLTKRQLGWFVLAGGLAAAAMMTKQVAVWNLLALIAIAPWWRRGQGYNAWESALPSVLVAAGAFVVVAAVVAPLAPYGALDDFFYANVTYNYAYVETVSSAERLFHVYRALLFILYFAGATAPLVLGSLAGLVTIIRRGLSPAYVLVIVWTVASGVGVATGGRFFPHYFLQLIPAMALLTAIAVHEQLDTISLRPSELRLTNPPVVAAVVLVVITLVTNGLLWTAPREAQQFISDDVYNQKRWEEQSAEVSEYVAERTEPNERIFNYGKESQLYFHADRLPASRYFYYWAYENDSDSLDATIDDLQQDPPPILIDTILPPLFEEEDRHPEMDALIRDYYQLDRRVEFADVYVRDD